MSLMRTYRRALGLSQSAFAAQLNVPLETYRPWDAGRREPPPQLLTRARTLAGYPDETVLLPLPVLALMIGVHVRTLHAAARSVLPSLSVGEESLSPNHPDTSSRF